MTPTCARCGAELADGAYVCDRCAQRLAADLTRAAGHADDAPAVVARQVRYGPGGGRGDEQPLPYDPVASERLWGVENTITTWARHVAEERGIEITFDGPGVITDGRNPLDPYSPLGGACRWLTGHVDWLRHRPEAAEAFDELDDACRVLRQLVDRPADRELAGTCDCGRILYALHGRQTVTCPDCELSWTVDGLRELLRAQLDDRLVTAAEAGRLLGYLGTDRTQQQLRKLVTKWGERGEVEIKDSVWRKPTPGEIKAALDKKPKEKPPTMIAVPVYRFGDVAVRLAQTPRRERRMAA